ncbi:MAG: tRNA (cytidine(34)-2'-O)-methyltransferase [Phycisphaerales bacterium]|nr:tRNA (cytidine(34)-2'-O)-methyltransferase [Phycisphaerales bacterium]
MLHLVLNAPEIPNNTGTIGRTAMATGCTLHLIRPLGFDLGAKALRRAGLDYWNDLDVRVHDSWRHYLASEAPARLWACSARATRSVWDVRFESGDALLFGGESDGLPESVLEEIRARWGEEAIIGLPQLQGIRSLNLACAATAVVYEGLRQIGLPE